MMITCALVTASVACGPASADAPILSKDDIRRMMADEVVVRVKPDPVADGAIVAAIDIKAAPERVWRVMTDCALTARIITGLVACRVIERDGAGLSDVREHIVSWGSLLPNVRSVFRSDYVVNRQIRFRRVAGDLKFLEGEWNLEPLANGGATRVTYQARIAVSSFVPAAMARIAVEQDVPKTLEALRRESVRGQR